MNIVVTVNATLGKRLRNARQWMSWVGWLIRLVGIGLILWGVLAGDGVQVGLGIFVVYPELIGLARHLVARRYGSTFTYTLRDEGIGVKSAISTAEISWAAIRSVRETGAEWVIRVPAGGVISFPKAKISVEDDATFRAFLANRALIRS
jgi:hypothetical protein